MNMYEQYKGLLFRLAYQLTGSAADAEDAVHDVFVKVQTIEPQRLTEPKAYLCKMVTNRCLDQLRAARTRREQYVGPWLPEPIATGEEEGYDSVARRDLLSYALLVLLERLSPAERAVFVLKEALGFDYSAIAELIDKSETNCRKLMSRAKGKMGISEDDLIGSDAVEEQWASRFLAALASGAVDTVLSMLAEDAVLLSDGGGKVSAAIHPVVSGVRVAKFLLGISRKETSKGNGVFAVKPLPMNGQTGMAIWQNGRITGVAFTELKDGLARSIYIVRNPDKLANVAGADARQA